MIGPLREGEVGPHWVRDWQEKKGESRRTSRLNRGGNRKLNFALHYMALVRDRSDEQTRRHIERRRAEGKTYKEAMRC
jgi:hypothetical protein